MKKWNYFFSMTLAALAFSACSSDDDPTTDSNEESNSYMTVRLMMPNGSLATKAATDGGYVNGSAAENEINVNHTHFYFYDAAGEYVTNGKLESITGAAGTTGDNVEWKSDALVVLGPTSIKPSQVLTLINIEDNVHTDLVGKSLAYAKSKIYDGTIATKTASGEFVMSTSVYKDDSNNEVATTKIDDDCFYTTKDAATSGTKKVTIYVERQVAKVNVTVNKTATTETTGFDEESSKYYSKKLEGFFVVDGVNKDIRVAIDGWTVNALNASSYLVKNISGITTDPFTDWNKAADFRCFWAKDANYSGDGAYDYAKTADAQADTYKDLVYYSWNEAKTNAYKTGMYLYENTAEKANQQVDPDDKANLPTLLVAAHLQCRNQGTTDAWTDLGTVYRKDGIFYTEAKLKNVLADALSQYRWKDASGTLSLVEGTNLTLDLTTFSKDNKSILTPKVTAVNKDGCTLYDIDGTTTKDVNDVNATITVSELSKKITCYTDGDCYYQVPIEHLSSTDAADGKFCGVVRNHVYELSLNNLTAIGGPVSTPDEKEVLIPGQENYYFISATLNILSWKVVKQDVVLK